MRTFIFSAALFVSMIPLLNGEDRAEQIKRLSHPEVDQRNKAQSQLVKKLRLTKKHEVFKEAMTEFFVSFANTSSPEAKARLVSIMQQIAPLYKTSFGVPFVGIEVEGKYKLIQGDSTQVIVVGEIVRDSPAENAALKTRDIIIAIGGVKFEHSAVSEFSVVREQYAPGETIQLTVFRSGEILQIPLTFGKVPNQPARQLLKRDLSYSEQSDKAAASIKEVELDLTDRQIHLLKAQIDTAQFLEENTFFTRWFKKMVSSL